MVSDKIRIIAFVKMMGLFLSNNPYISHIMTLIVANVNISNEISLADFDCHVLITWGKKVMDEINPADIPKISIAFIINYLPPGEQIFIHLLNGSLFFFK